MTSQYCHSGLDPGDRKGGGVSGAREHIQSFQLDSRFRGNDSFRTYVKKC